MAAKRPVSVRVLREGMNDPLEALKEGHTLREIRLGDALPDNKRLVVGQAYQSRPKWLDFFSPQERAAMADLLGAAPAAVLFVRVERQPGAAGTARWLAFSFGLGFQSLRPESVEPLAGLQIALNRIGRDMIKSVDVRRPEDATIQTRSQNSRTGEIFDFGIDTSHIILQSLTGRCSDEHGLFGGLLTGSDGLKVTCDVCYATINDKANQIVEAYYDETFREHFPWFGKITPIRDRAHVARLDGELEHRLAVGQTEGIHLAPPEITDYQRVDQFKYTRMRRGELGFDELCLSDYLSVSEEISTERLKSDKVRIQEEHQTQAFDRWPVYNCVSAEIEMDGLLYVLSAGKWYGITREFVALVNAQIDAIAPADLVLPSFRASEYETEYNARAAAETPGIYILDRNLIRFEGERGRVEFCDLITDQRQIIHVKKRSRASVLSHLFMQGYVSAEAFLDYPELRQQIRERFPNLAHLVPFDQPTAQDYEIVFALLYKERPELTFFSKVALVGVLKQLRRIGFAVSLCWIPSENQERARAHAGAAIEISGGQDAAD